MKPTYVYVAGPYSKGDPVVNVAAAIDAAETLVRMGHTPYVPHLSMFWHYRHHHEYGFWLEYDRQWLRKCDVLLRLPGESSGADKEVALAREIGTPVVHNIEEVPAATTSSPPIVCLCGSSRFIEHFAVLQWEFEKAGKIALGLHYLPPSYPPDHVAEHEGVEAAMDRLHLRKIEMADEVFIVNVGGYIGQSTSREIAHAKRLGKPIRYLEPVEVAS